MSGMWGSKIKLSIFGESHGNAIGITIDGLPAGFSIDMDKIMMEMARRAPGKSSLSTPRKESDIPEILSGYFEGKTTGTPLCAIIRNSNTKSKDYSKLKDVMRPGHADYTGAVRYKGFNDYRGGGHFSGRITAPLVFAGAICKQILEVKGIIVSAHINSIGKIKDCSFLESDISDELLNSFKEVVILNTCNRTEIYFNCTEEISEDELKIVKIDVDENPETAQKFGIMSIPTLLFKKDGEVVKQVAGVHTKEQIKAIVAELS